MKKCQTCIYFPCTKFQCNILDKEGCENYESIVSKEIKSLEKWKNDKLKEN